MDEPAQSDSDPNMPKELRRWEGIRSKGKARFILVTGVLCWGLPMFLLMTFVFGRRNGLPPSPGSIAGSAVLWIIGGICFGWWIWRISERKYWAYIETREESDDD